MQSLINMKTMYTIKTLNFFNFQINSLNNPSSKHQHIKSSVQLLNTILRYIKKLETHEVFQQKDLTFNNIWQCLNKRLILIHDENGKSVNNILDDIAVALKFLFEFSSVECFCNRFIRDIAELSVLKVSHCSEKVLTL